MAGAVGRRARQRSVRLPRAGTFGVGNGARPNQSRSCCTVAATPTSRAAPWTEADLALVDEADSLLGPVEAARPVARRRSGGGGDTFDTAERVINDLGLRGFADAATLASRFGENNNGARRGGFLRASHLRPRARRRGPGSHGDAVADAGPPVPVGIDDPRRRSGPGQQARRGRVLGRRAVVSPDPQRNPPRLAEHQLPHAVRGDGRRVAVARGRGSHHRAVAVGAQHWRVPALHLAVEPTTSLPGPRPRRAPRWPVPARWP